MTLKERIGGIFARRRPGIAKAIEWVHEAIAGTEDPNLDNTPWFIKRYRKMWAAAIGAIVGWGLNKVGLDANIYQSDLSDMLLVVIGSALATRQIGPNAPKGAM